MSSMEERLNKLREERVAREKARIEKLRELNLKKYNKNEPQPTRALSNSNLSIAKPKTDTSTLKHPKNFVKNNFHVNGTTKRPISAPAPTTKKPITNPPKTQSIPKPENKVYNIDKLKPKETQKKEVPKIDVKKNVTIKPNPDTKRDGDKKVNPPTRKSMAPNGTACNSKLPRKSMPSNSQNQKESVFDRLYKPKQIQRQTIDNAHKLHTDAKYLNKVIKDSKLIMNKRNTMFETKTSQPVRRSISAVHFKRISKSELSNCVHKWASIGEKLNKVHLNDINEDEGVKEEKVVSAVKSERKKVKFQTPVPYNFNTPKPEELQLRLQNWLTKRGKSLDSYHHLQCFGLHHLPKELEVPKFELYDDENKENIAVESDSDNDSFVENMNDVGDFKDNRVDFGLDKWRRASNVSDSVDCNESRDTTMTSGEVMAMHHVDELLLGALNDLTELLKEGFDWEQCARWLRAIRDRFPSAPDNAAYWECRAALEERRGDLPASVQCWEEAIAKGTERSVVEANLDQLLDKFMQLKISPNGGHKKVDPKLVDVKNVFMSTIIRFAVQQAKLRQSAQCDPPKFTVTPVRRSGRLSTQWRATPLRICATLKQANELGNPVFRPNPSLAATP